MSTQENVQIAKHFYAAMGRSDKPGLQALSAEDIEWIIPGGGWTLAGTTRDWRICFRRPAKWKLHSQTPLNL